MPQLARLPEYLDLGYHRTNGGQKASMALLDHLPTSPRMETIVILLRFRSPFLWEQRSMIS